MPEPTEKPVHRSFRLTKTDGPPRDAAKAEWFEAFRFAVGQQTILLLFSALLLDGGYLFRSVVFSTGVFWAAVLAVIVLDRVQRRVRRTRLDLYLLKYGIWLMLLVAQVVARILGSPHYGL